MIEKERQAAKTNQVKVGLPYSAEQLANVTYYFEIGRGLWSGDFRFDIVSWQNFSADNIGFKNRFLALGMFIVVKLLGNGKITSLVEGFPDRGEVGVAANDVRISKFGVTLYLLKEQYILNPDGRQVWVQSRERFGPIPFLFNLKKEHPAEILDSGMHSVYYIPLLGTEWVGRYTVREDHDHIDSHMTCKWGEAYEVIDRVR